ncbi:MAG: glutamate 5-kinase [Candidatus Omnitrophota bacterium]
MKKSERDYQRIVIKIGASLLTDLGVVDRLVRQIADLLTQKRRVILVSSGAIACGMGILGLKTRPARLDYLQAAASLGQSELMELYRKRFSALGVKCAQILLTWEDFDDRSRYLNAKNTLQVLLEWGSLPIINENDTVSVDEIKFGDNDRLSALVANLIEADMLIILSDVEGLLDPKTSEVIRVVNKITPKVERLASSSRKAISVGGMKTKLAAARIAMESQIPCLVVDGKKSDALQLALRDPVNAGTLFLPAEARLPARKKWLIFCSLPKGKIQVDEGARAALLGGKSLLSVGVVGSEGNFVPGDTVELAGKDGVIFARGKVNFSSPDLDKIKGRQKMKEVIHRDHLVIRGI